MRMGKWGLSSDERNYIITEYGVTEEGKPFTAPRYYFSTMQGALNHLVQLGVRETELINLQAISDRLAELEHIIKHIGEEV